MYREVDRGRFDSSLLYGDYEIAYTNYDAVIAFNDCAEHEQAIIRFAEKYDLPIEWID